MAPKTTNYAEIQNDEIEALRSIYMDDFVEEEAKTGAWKKAADRAFRIHLRSHIGEERKKIILTLMVSLPPTYPKTLPRLDLRFGDIRQKEQKQAQEVISITPKSLLGSEMIFEIATSLQEILDDNATSVGGLVPDVPTLDEERAAKEIALKVRAQQDEEKKRQQAVEAEESEEKLLLELVKQRKSQSTSRDIKSVDPLDQAFSGDNILGGVNFERPARIRNRDGNGTIVINCVHQRVQYRQGHLSNLFTVQPWNSDQVTPTHQNSPFLVLKECKISSTKRSVQNLESRLEFYTHLKPHQSVIQPLTFRIQRDAESASSEDEGQWTVIILLELAERRSLRETLETVDKLDIKLVRSWSIRLVEGLHHLHRHGSAHGRLHLGNILLETGETEMGDRKLTYVVFRVHITPLESDHEL